MAKYRYVGTVTEIGGVPQLDRFGQAVDLSDEVASIAVLGGAALMTEEDFEGVGFTPAEIERYENPGARRDMDAVFESKFLHAHGLSAALRERFEKEAK